ncbi:MAG: rhodanese-like domain-containing protein [Gammaproteobacteria bacterium]|nr:rhodanese-like domain-containing protein [Gammaproteobacteria bacterium]
MMNTKLIVAGLLAAGLTLSVNAIAADKPVGITPKMKEAEVMHDGNKVKITRNQNNKNTVNPSFAKTSRPCPPFCIQPSTLAPGVETIGEVEMIDYLQKMAAGDKTILVVDSRTPDWVKKGTIPGAVNIPWTKLNPAKGADPISIGEIMQDQFNVTESEGLWNFDNARTLVLFCNGMWCGQSPNNIKNLLKFGYPAHKIKWYRGGMQDWEVLGLTTVVPE